LYLQFIEIENHRRMQNHKELICKVCVLLGVHISCLVFIETCEKVKREYFLKLKTVKEMGG
jgi:hypothetical protein